MAKQVQSGESITVRVQDFSGGLNTTVAPGLLNNNEGQKANRVNYDQKGTIQPQKGRRKRYPNAFSGSPVAGLGAYYSKSGTANLLVAAGTEVFTDEPHMDYSWDTQDNWKQTGTELKGKATADRTDGSLMTEEVKGVSEVTALCFPSASSTYNMYLGFNGETSTVRGNLEAYITGAYNADSVKTELEGFPSLKGNIRVTQKTSHVIDGTSYGLVFIVEFINAQANKSMPDFTTRFSHASVKVIVTTQGKTPGEVLAEHDLKADLTKATVPTEGTLGPELLCVDTPVRVIDISPMNGFTFTGAWANDVASNPAAIFGNLRRSNNAGNTAEATLTVAEGERMCFIGATSAQGVSGGVAIWLDDKTVSLPNLYSADTVYGKEFYTTEPLTAGEHKVKFVVQGGWVYLDAIKIFKDGKATLSLGDSGASTQVMANDGFQGKVSGDKTVPHRAYRAPWATGGVHLPDSPTELTTAAYTAISTPDATNDNFTASTSNGYRASHLFIFDMKAVAKKNAGIPADWSLLDIIDHVENIQILWNGFGRGYTPVSGFGVTLEAYDPRDNTWTAIGSNATSAASDILGLMLDGSKIDSDGFLMVRAITTNNSNGTSGSYIFTYRTDIVMTVKVPEARQQTGEWVSKELDLLNFGPKDITFPVKAVAPVGSAKAYFRTKSFVEADYGPWVEFDISKPLQAGNLKHKAQFKLVLNGAAGSNRSPRFEGVGYNVIARYLRGLWFSQSVDISQAKDKTTGKVSLDAVIGTGQAILSYSHSTDSGATWSPWAPPLADGSLVTADSTSHIKLCAEVIGDVVEVKEIKMFFDGEPGATSLVSGLQPNAEYDFTQLRDMVIIVNGKDFPKKWNGVDAPSSLGGSPPAFQFVETHLNRAWGAGDPENPSRLRFSDVLNPESWPALNFIDFNPEDGDKITGILRYGQTLVVSKRNTMAILTGDRSSNFAVQWLDHDAGAEGFRGMQIVDKYLGYVARDGIRFSDLTKTVRATERMQMSWASLNHRRLNQGAIVSVGNYMLVALPGAGSLVNDQVWFFDVLRAAWSIIPGWKVSNWLKFHQYGEEILLAGDSETGQVYQVLTGTTDASGSPMEYDFITRDFDAGAPERYKVLRDFILIVGGVESETSIKVSFIVDGVENEVPLADTTIPAGSGVVHSIRLIPPVYGAVLGQRVSMRFQGRAHIHGMALGMIVRGVVPGVS